MFTFDSFVDTVQDTKLAFLDTFVKSEEVRKPLQEFVESQREYTKGLFQTVTDFNKAMYVEASKVFKDAIKV